MPDHARSDDAAVQRQLDRLAALGVPDTLGLERITALLARLGDPQHALPPVLHVAGTNGKGSTCALLETIYGQAGYRTGVYTSPHLVHFEERCRIEGQIVAADALLSAFADVERARRGNGADQAEVSLSYF